MSINNINKLAWVTKNLGKSILYINCSVKAGAAKNREGVAAVREDGVDICVTAKPNEGKANKAVIKVLSKALGMPKSILEITRGHTSQDKTVAVQGYYGADDGSYLKTVRAYLEAAASETAARGGNRVKKADSIPTNSSSDASPSGQTAPTPPSGTPDPATTTP